MSRSNSLGCLPYLIVMLLFGLILALFAGWTEGNMEWLFGKVAGRPVDVPYWLAFVTTFFTNIFGLGFNILCELAKFVFP
jgi:thiamine transporter ThiT